MVYDTAASASTGGGRGGSTAYILNAIRHHSTNPSKFKQVWGGLDDSEQAAAGLYRGGVLRADRAGALEVVGWAR